MLFRSTNKNYDSFGQVLNSLAQDLAHWEVYLERKFGMPIEQLNKIPEDQRVVVDKNAKPGVGENSVFYGEGGPYALKFRDWVKDNLSESTGRILDRLVKRHRENLVAEEKYDAANKVYTTRQEQLATERKEEKRAKDRKSTRLNSSHTDISRMPSSA